MAEQHRRWRRQAAAGRCRQPSGSLLCGAWCVVRGACCLLRLVKRQQGDGRKDKRKRLGKWGCRGCDGRWPDEVVAGQFPGDVACQVAMRSNLGARFNHGDVMDGVSGCGVGVGVWGMVQGALAVRAPKLSAAGQMTEAGVCVTVRLQYTLRYGSARLMRSSAHRKEAGKRLELHRAGSQ